jgi:DNA-binding NtrC family response regulator
MSQSNAADPRLAATPSLWPLAEQIALAAALDVPLLLTGETGTGKAYLARVIHAGSPRRDFPFLAVPCSAYLASRIDHVLFGHVVRPYPGSTRAVDGKFAAAGNGTIFLGEVNSLGPEQQARLVSVLETGKYVPVGRSQTQTCTARVIAASHQDLTGAIAAGQFRADLYHRLNGMSFHVPPLRERAQDIEPLARAAVARFSTKYSKGLSDMSPDALAALRAFPWPGNIRQLENAVQYAVLVSSGPTLLHEHLPPPVRGHVPPALNSNDGPHRVIDESLSGSMHAVERDFILRALAMHGNNRARAAQALGISRATLYKKMKRYGLLPSRRVEEPEG